jgi:hypothetical protein
VFVDLVLVPVTLRDLDKDIELHVDPFFGDAMPCPKVAGGWRTQCPVRR